MISMFSKYCTTSTYFLQIDCTYNIHNFLMFWTYLLFFLFNRRFRFSLFLFLFLFLLLSLTLSLSLSLALFLGMFAITKLTQIYLSFLGSVIMLINYVVSYYSCTSEFFVILDTLI